MNENVAEPKRERYYKRTSDGKLILRNVLSHYVPLDYSKGLKQGFAAPDSSWFKGESIDYIKNLLFDKRARIYDYIQPSLARDLMNEHFEGRTNRRLLIWSLLCFEWWNRIFK
jgi:asparagine synthase (glutamine-hydrolysing)